MHVLMGTEAGLGTGRRPAGDREWWWSRAPSVSWTATFSVVLTT